MDLITIWWSFPELIQVSGGEEARLHVLGGNGNGNAETKARTTCYLS